MRLPPQTTRVRCAAPADRRQISRGLLWRDENRELSDERVRGEGVNLSLPINKSTPKKSFAVLIGVMIQADQRGPSTSTGTRGSC